MLEKNNANEVFKNISQKLTQKLQESAPTNKENLENIIYNFLKENMAIYRQNFAISKENLFKAPEQIENLYMESFLKTAAKNLGNSSSKIVHKYRDSLPKSLKEYREYMIIFLMSDPR